jgi:hypothetical protein
MMEIELATAKNPHCAKILTDGIADGDIPI